MPRIDPLQLLKCLGVLLTSHGGIRSKEEVQRLASLMMKFSKKLVSKCVYILILKNTETELLGMFMSAGGWTLVYTWLSDGIIGKNWALVTELLELLLICPVDVERLKSNSIPRLVKGLSKDETLGGVNVLATKLVEQWLKIVKDETVPDKEIIPIIKQADIIVDIPSVTISESVHEVTVDTTPAEPESQNTVEISPQTFYKVTVRDGKQVIHKIENDPGPEIVEAKEEVVEAQPQIVEDNKEKEIKKNERKEERDRSKDRKKDSHDKSKHKSRSNSSSKSSSHSHNSSKDKSSSKDKNKERHRDKEKDRHRDKERDRKHKEHRSNGSIKSSSSSSKDKDKDKEKQAEKDKATLAKIQPQSIEKLGKIPKKSSSDKEKSKSDKKSDETIQKQKPSISIEVRKKGEGDRPKTVKVFNSKLRSTGLEEAPKPPPSRTAVKKSPATMPSVLPLKRPSPSREAPPPPEKKMKLPDHEEKQIKPGGIKLIPAKPKHKVGLRLLLSGLLKICL